MTGAIFARGSCRALKWMALLAVVFMLGGGSAAAQLRAPSNVTLTATAGGTLTLSWAPPNGGDVVHGYQYRLKAGTADFPDWVDTEPTITDGSTTDQAAQLGASARSVAVSGLTDATTYMAELRVVGADNADGEATYGPVRTPRSAVARDAPDALTPDDTKTKDGDGEVTVAWTAPAAGTGITGFEYRYAEGSSIGSSVKWMTVPGGSSATMVTIKGLTNGLTYAIDVRAVIGSIKGAGLGDDLFRQTPAGKPKAPVDPEFDRSEDKKSGTLRWREPDDGGSVITNYEYRYHDGSVSWTAWELVSGGGGALSTPVSGLMADKAYTFEVRARNAIGAGPAASTDPSDTTGDPDPTPGTPTGIRGLVYDTKLVRQQGSRFVDVEMKTIGGKRRNHVVEGATDHHLQVQVEWTVKELREIYNGQAATWKPDPVGVMVEVMSDMTITESWASMIDGESQDVHFPNPTRGTGGFSSAKVMVPVPARPAASARDAARAYETGRLRIYINQDDFEAENEVFYVMAVQDGSDVDVQNGRDIATEVTVIEDNDPQKVTLKGPPRIYEGASGGSFEVTAVPPRVDLPLRVRLDVVDLADDTVVRGDEYSLSDSTPTLNPDGDGMANTVAVTLEVPNPDGNRKDEEYKLRATVVPYGLTSGVDDSVAPFDHAVTFVDAHKLPRLRVSPMEDKVKEGEAITLTLTIDRNPADTIRRPGEVQEFTNEAVNVMLTASAMSTAGRDDYELPAQVSFAERKATDSWTDTKTVEIMATMDGDLGEAEMLVVDFEVDGTKNATLGPNTDVDMYAGGSMLTIEDDTARLVWAKENVGETVYAAKKEGMGADEKFNPGEMIELMGDALFEHADGVTLSFSAMSDDTDVAMVAVSGGAVTVTAGTKAGVMGYITITAHASMPSGVEVLEQTDRREASIKFPVEVGLAALSIMLSGPEDMNVVEGGVGAMVTATANRMVTADTKVMLMRDRAMSTASDEDFMADPITILAGQMRGSTMVMAVEDNMMENAGNMAEKLVLYGQMEGDMAVPVEGNVELYLWDAAVPALPVIAQLLLAGFLAVGGIRRYRRR